MSNELTEKKQNNIEAPSYLKEFAGEGAEDITSDLIEKSFVQMAHKDEGDLKLGDWYDSITKQPFGKEIVVTVCKISRSWRKFTSDFKLEKQSSDGITWDDGTLLKEFVDAKDDNKLKHENWACCFIDMFVLINKINLPIPFIVSFKGTSYRTGKKLTTVIAKYTKGSEEACYARNYTLYTELEKKGSNSYSVCNYRLNPGFNTEEMVKRAHSVRKMVMDIAPVMDEMNDAEPETESDGVLFKGNDYD